MKLLVEQPSRMVPYWDVDVPVQARDCLLVASFRCEAQSPEVSLCRDLLAQLSSRSGRRQTYIIQDCKFDVCWKTKHGNHCGSHNEGLQICSVHLPAIELLTGVGDRYYDSFGIFLERMESRLKSARPRSTSPDFWPVLILCSRHQVLEEAPETHGHLSSEHQSRSAKE